MNEDIINAYVKNLELRRFKPRGIEEQVRACKILKEYLKLKNMNFDKIGIREAGAFREYLGLQTGKDGKNRFNPKTINYIITHLRGFYRYLVKSRIVLQNPFADIERMRVGTTIIKNILSINQMEKLLNGITIKTWQDFKFKVILEVLYATGARVSEISKLEWKDIYLHDGYIIIRNDKNRKDRKSPLTECAVKLLAIYLTSKKGGNRGLVFTEKEKNPRTLNVWLNTRLRKTTRRLNLPGVSCHGIRHTIATHLFKSGAGIREVQEFLGHRLIKNTEVYIRVVLDDLKKVLEATHPRERKVNKYEA